MQSENEFQRIGWKRDYEIPDTLMGGVLKILLRPQSQAITILGINYKGMRGQKQVWEGKLTTDTSSRFSLFPSHHSLLALCTRSHHPSLAHLACFTLSRVSRVY